VSQDATPVLDLDAELRQLDITYKSTKYDLRSRAELSILESYRLSELLKGYDSLTDADLDEETAIKIGEVAQEVAEMLVKNPPEGGFPEQLCVSIIAFWHEQHRPPTQRRAPQDRRPSTRPGTATRRKKK
jgi:hypothetical protein